MREISSEGVGEAHSIGREEYPGTPAVTDLLRGSDTAIDVRRWSVAAVVGYAGAKWES